MVPEELLVLGPPWKTEKTLISPQTPISGPLPKVAVYSGGGLPTSVYLSGKYAPKPCPDVYFWSLIQSH